FKVAREEGEDGRTKARGTASSSTSNQMPGHKDGLIERFWGASRPKQRCERRNNPGDRPSHPCRQTAVSARHGLGLEDCMATAGGVKQELGRHERHTWELVALAPSKSMWDLRNVSVKQIAQCTWKAMLEDRLTSIAAELGFWFAFALFPTLICAATILGLVARSAFTIYDKLLGHLALVVPSEALGMVVHTFNQTTAHSTSGKLTLGLLGAIWSASVGISAVQDATNEVYKITERRSYIKARMQAILLTLLLIVLVSLSLGALFAGDFGATWAHDALVHSVFGSTAVMLVRIGGWIVAAGFLALSFAAVYYWAPDLR